MSELLRGKKHWIIILLIALFVEMVLFNYRFYLSLSNEKVSCEVHLADGTELQYGVPYSLENGLMLNIDNIDTEVRNISLGVDDISSLYNDGGYRKEVEDVLVADIFVSDEGDSSLYSIKKEYISSLYPNSQIISVEPFGEIHSIQVSILPDIEKHTGTGREKRVVFNDISLNDKVRFDFDVLRFIITLFIISIIYSFVFGKYRLCDYSDKVTLIKTGIVFLVTVGALLAVLSLGREQFSTVGLGYQELAKSMLDGHFWVEKNTNPILANMDNPYSASDRKALGVDAHFDTAYFDGYYYIYFGITPVILFFLPYYLITGYDLSYFHAESIILVIIVLLGFILVDNIRKNVAPRAPWKITMLLSVVLSSLSGVILFVKRVQIYYTAISTALMLVLMGVSLWLISARRFKNDKKLSATLMGILGSFSMALAVGARPQFALASFLAIGIYWDLIKKIREYFKSIMIIISPYVIVGTLLMYYNYARFGSPFDFGANYNMTSYDMTHMGIHPSKLLVGVWYYLFNLPSITIEFPYFIASEGVINYPGYLFFEKQIGGAFILLPISFLLIKICSKKYRQRMKNKIQNYNSIILIIVIAIICTFVTVVTDTLMGGIATRYQMDFRIYILLASVFVAFVLINRDVNGEKYYKLVSALCLVALFFGLFTITAQYETLDYAYETYETSVFIRIRELFGLVTY